MGSITGKATELITFSRASLATVTASDGKIKWAPHNLLLASEQFDSSSYTKTNVTVTANAIAAPNGTTTADKIEATATAATTMTIGASNAAPCVFSVWVKKGNTATSMNTFGVRNTTTSTNLIFADINLDTGAITYGTGSSGVTVVADVNGWWKVNIQPTSGVSPGDNILCYFASAGAVKAAGDFVYLWGAHLYRTDLGGMVANTSAYPMYNPTTPKNLMGYSEDFSNAAWSKANTTVTGGFTAPNGLASAWKLEAGVNAGTGGQQVYQNLTTVGSGPYVYSIYAKQGLGATDSNKFAIYNNSTATTLASLTIDYSTGVITQTIGSSATSVNIGSGWWRISIPFSGGVVGNNIRFYVGSTGGVETPGEFLYAYGAQLSDSASLDTYSPVIGAAPSAAAYYGPRLDYDPATLAAKGLLVEQQSTNLCLRSEEFDNASWTKSNITVTANSAVAPSNVQTADTLTAAAGNATINQGFTTTAVAFTFSIYLKRKTGTGNVDITMDGTTWVTQTINSSTWTRCIVTQTGVAGTSNPGVRIVTSGDEVYAWGAQAE